MSLILNIDTSSGDAYVSLAKNGEPLSSAFNDNEKDHASWIQPAIDKLMQETGTAMHQLKAVGVSIGPGSYTGLRIGLSTAKGICYALNIPLIAEVSLKLIAFAAIKYLATNPEFSPPGFLFCPMIDARRMEVYTALYNSNLDEIIKPTALILDANSFEEQLRRQKILFLGNGSKKFQQVCQNNNAFFKKIPLEPFALATLTYKKFIGNNFVDLAYIEPLYVKEFFTKKPSQK
jgi:tRNA threonylcarbamoyladenosine biosynthesis protein TsaB